MANKNNTGDNNSGNRNSGNRNSGNWNSGDWNSGDWNSGNRNSGDCNSGNCNSGYRNSGYRNSGDWNSGDRNSGDWNSGNRNSGDCNSGNCNSGDWNSGCFNTDEPCARFFNRDSKVKLSEFRQTTAWPDFSDMQPCVWIEESIMTDDEKKEFPTYKTTGGYIKTLAYKEAWAVWKRKTSKENWEKVLALPNFSWEVFTSITGIEIDDSSESKKKVVELREKADELLAQAKALEASL
jgi:hypothetical protein